MKKYVVLAILLISIFACPMNVFALGSNEVSEELFSSVEIVDEAALLTRAIAGIDERSAEARAHSTITANISESDNHRATPFSRAINEVIVYEEPIYTTQLVAKNRYSNSTICEEYVTTVITRATIYDRTGSLSGYGITAYAKIYWTFDSDIYSAQIKFNKSAGRYTGSTALAVLELYNEVMEEYGIGGDNGLIIPNPSPSSSWHEIQAGATQWISLNRHCTFKAHTICRTLVGSEVKAEVNFSWH